MENPMTSLMLVDDQAFDALESLLGLDLPFPSEIQSMTSPVGINDPFHYSLGSLAYHDGAEDWDIGADTKPVLPLSPVRGHSVVTATLPALPQHCTVVAAAADRATSPTPSLESAASSATVVPSVSSASARVAKRKKVSGSSSDEDDVDADLPKKKKRKPRRPPTELDYSAFACDLCPKKYATKSGLYNHNKTKHHRIGIGNATVPRMSNLQESDTASVCSIGDSDAVPCTPVVGAQIGHRTPTGPVATPRANPLAAIAMKPLTPITSASPAATVPRSRQHRRGHASRQQHSDEDAQDAMQQVLELVASGVLANMVDTRATDKVFDLYIDAPATSVHTLFVTLRSLAEEAQYTFDETLTLELATRQQCSQALGTCARSVDSNGNAFALDSAVLQFSPSDDTLHVQARYTCRRGAVSS